MMRGDVDAPSLPAVHTMQERHRGAFEDAARDADWIVAQLVAPDYPVDYVRTQRLREVYGRRLIVWPNVYFTGYAPEYVTMQNPSLNNFSGPLLAYQNEKILLGFMLDWPIDKTVAFLREPSRFDEVRYGEAAAIGMAELKRRELQTDVAISDFVEEHYAQRRLLYIMNHPSGFVIEELAARILQKMGEKVRHRAPAEWFGEWELLSAWHPENAYLRQKHGFAFPAVRLYKGVHLRPANTPLGFEPAGPRIYDDLEMVEATYAFYEAHRAALRDHPRVKQILEQKSPLG